MVDAAIINYDQSFFMSDAKESLLISSCDGPIEYGWSSCNYSIVSISECSQLALRCERGKNQLFFLIKGLQVFIYSVFFCNQSAMIMVMYIWLIHQYNTIVMVPLMSLVYWSSAMMVYGTLCVMILLPFMMQISSVLSMDIVVSYKCNSKLHCTCMFNGVYIHVVCVISLLFLCLFSRSLSPFPAALALRWHCSYQQHYCCK